MSNIKQNKVIITTAIAVILFGSSYNNQIYGHDFVGDESASFLALMDQMQAKMKLINTNVNANNQSLAQDHLNEINDELYTEEIKKEIAERNERIANEISSIIDETSIAMGGGNNQDISGLVKTFNDVIEVISVRIDQDALTNATIQALYFADLINSIDISYATALGTKPMNMSGMGMSMDMNDSNHSSMSDGDMSSAATTAAVGMDRGMSKNDSDMKSMSKDTDNNSNTNETSSIITNVASYQTAKELTNDAIDLFNSTIKQNIPSNATDNANAIESGLQQLKDMIESKAPYDKVMGVIHGIIHTNTQVAFNLPLKTSK